MKRYLTAALVLIAVMLALAPAGRLGSTGPTTVVVSPGNMNGWAIVDDNGAGGGSGSLVAGPGVPPAGVGSARLQVNATSAGWMFAAPMAATPLSTLTALSYSTYRTSVDLGNNEAISLQFNVDYDLTDSYTGYQGRIVFEPYQTFPGGVPQGTWQTWNALAGKWWQTANPSSPTRAPYVGNVQQAGPLPCPQSAPCTLATLIADYPNIGVHATLGAVVLKAGSGWSSFDGNADALTVGVSGSNTIYDFEANCTTDCYVRPDGNDANSGTGDTPALAMKTIQAAVNQVSAGGTVHVAAGTYSEQVDIEKQLTLNGAGAGSTIIQSPATLATMFTTSAANKPVVYVHADGTTISNLTVDGNGVGSANYRFEGIAFYNAGGTVTNTAIVHVRETPLNGNQHGIALYAYNADAVARTLTVTNNTISDYQKNGMALNGAGLTATVSGNTVTGDGAFSGQAQNGIQIGYGAAGSITGNTISGNDCTDVSAGCTADPTSAANADGAAGILLYEPGAGTITVSGNALSGDQFGVWTVAATDLSISSNTITGSTSAVAVWNCDQWCDVSPVGTTGTITGNTISGAAYGLLVRAYAATPAPAVSAHNNSITGSTAFGAWADVPLDATDNWWGSANGPQNVSNTFNVGSQGDKVSDNVTFVPWLNAAPPAGVSFAPVTTTNPVGSYSSIQAGVNASASGGTVNAAAGTFTENVTIPTPLTLAGAGQASTTVVPAVSIPNPCPNSTLCGSANAASNIILIQASNVTVHDMTLDGHNPLLSGGPLVGGVTIDARNGILENYYAGVFNNTTIHHVTVKNIFLRAVYASSGGSGFNIHDDTVTNVQGDPQSIAMFNWVGSGTFANNTVSNSNDGIVANHSSGTQFLNNTVTSSGSGVHTDNAGDGGGVADLIQGNTISSCMPNGYGVFTFVPYISPTVTQNTISGCAVGLATFGQGAAVATTFSNNTVDGSGAPGSIGALVTTDQVGYGAANVSATLTNNTIKNNAVGIDADSQIGYTSTVNATDNAIFGNTAGVTLTDNPTLPGGVTGGIGTTVLNMTPNWWGSDTGPANATSNPGGAGNSVPDGVVYSPWIGIGTDASPATGFQHASPMTWIAGPAVCGATCIQAAIDDASNGDTVQAKTGVFNEHVNVNKSITLTAASNPIIDGGGAGNGITISVPNVTVSSFEVRNVQNGIVVAAGANNATISSNNVHNFNCLGPCTGTSSGISASAATGLSVATNTINGGHTGSCIGGFWGIQIQDVSGTINGNMLSGIGNGLTTGCQEGRAIEADNTGAVNITNNIVGTYQKSGIIVRNTVNSIITGNTTAGEGPTTAIAQNGITVTSTGTATITGNHTSGNAYTPAGTVSCGILVLNTATITGNDSTQDQDGICVAGGNGTQVTHNSVTKHLQQGILVDTAANALVDANTIDGQGNGTAGGGGSSPDTDARYYGVFAVDSTGTISNNTVTGITLGPANGVQSGIGIRLTARSGNSADMTISGNTLTNIQKGAIVVANPYGGTAVNAGVTNNIVTGNGPITYIAQNGIQISYGATGTVSGNNVSGYDYAPSTWAAAGILLYEPGTTSVTNNNVHDGQEGLIDQSGNNTTVSGNTFSNIRDTSLIAWVGSSNGAYSGNTVMGMAGSTGVYISDNSNNNTFTGNALRNNAVGAAIDYTNYGNGTPSANVFHNGCFAGNTTAGMETIGTQVGGPVNAESNWWNTVNGANPPGHGDVIIDATTIDATAFLTAPVAGCPAPSDSDGDGIANNLDNCPLVYNPDQKDTAKYNWAAGLAGTHSAGDACSLNISGDGYLDSVKLSLGKDVNVYCATMRADINQDGTVDGLDLNQVARHFLQMYAPVDPANGFDTGVQRISQNASGWLAYVANTNAQINGLDLNLFARYYLHSVSECP